MTVAETRRKSKIYMLFGVGLMVAGGLIFFIMFLSLFGAASVAPSGSSKPFADITDTLTIFSRRLYYLLIPLIIFMAGQLTFGHGARLKKRVDKYEDKRQVQAWLNSKRRR